MRAFGVTMIFLMTAFFAANANAYELNGKEYPTDAFFVKVGKVGPTVTLGAKEMPLSIFLEEIFKQTSVKATWQGFDDEAPAVSVQAKDAPLLHVLAEIAKENNFNIYQMNSDDKGLYLRKEHPILSYGVHGPTLVTWHGKLTSSAYDFTKDPPAVVEVTKYRMSFIRDVDTTLQTYDPGGGAIHRNRPVRFVLSAGTEHTLQSDHAPNTFGGPWPDWQFEPVAEWAGKNADVSVTFPVSVSKADGKVSQQEIEFTLKDCPL